MPSLPIHQVLPYWRKLMNWLPSISILAARRNLRCHLALSAFSLSQLVMPKMGVFLRLRLICAIPRRQHAAPAWSIHESSGGDYHTGSMSRLCRGWRTSLPSAHHSPTPHGHAAFGKTWPSRVARGGVSRIDPWSSPMIRSKKAPGDESAEAIKRAVSREWQNHAVGQPLVSSSRPDRIRHWQGRWATA